MTPDRHTESRGTGKSDSQGAEEKKTGMLVLTRKIKQGIVISGNIVVRVLGVQRDRVKIGISAPLEVTILRQELLERENQQLANELSVEPEENGQSSGS